MALVVLVMEAPAALQVDLLWEDSSEVITPAMVVATPDIQVEVLVAMEVEAPVAMEEETPVAMEVEAPTATEVEAPEVM